MRRNNTILFILLHLFLLKAAGQGTHFVKPIYKFGDVKAEDFNVKYYAIDSNASAVMLADIGSSKFEGNTNGFFSIVYNRFVRIRIINKTGFGQADFEINLHRIGTEEEKLDKIEAVTYNIKDGQVVPIKLEKSSIFKSEVIKGLSVVKFTMPEIKEGSIIECRYTIKTPFFEFLRSWSFQGNIPRLWSQYDVAIPGLFNYVMEQQGDLVYDLQESKETNQSYNILIPGENGYDASKAVTVQSGVINKSWGIKNIPGLKSEAYTSNIGNYLEKIEFQLHNIKWPDGTIEEKMGDWKSFSSSLLKNEYFGRDLSERNSFATEIDMELKTAKTDKEKATLIFNYIRDNFTCTDHDTYWLDNSLKKTYQDKKGNVAEINLLLTSIYKSRGFEADPVLLSTKENGKVNEVYPLRRKYNYVITRLKVDNNYFLLDASDNLLGFGMLGENAYNGSGRLIAETPMVIPMSPDSLNEVKFTSIGIGNDEGGKISGNYKSSLGPFESIDIRKQIKKEGSNTYFSRVKKAFNTDITIENQQIDSLKILDKPVTISYDFKFENSGDIIYFNPLFTEGLKNNPFTIEHRQYPVEMPYGLNETYVLNLEIPKGYKLEEMPKSVKVKLKEADGFFEYMIGQFDDKVQLRTRLVLNKATFPSEDYASLRDFYALIVKKESEMIVFKKI